MLYGCDVEGWVRQKPTSGSLPHLLLQETSATVPTQATWLAEVSELGPAEASPDAVPSTPHRPLILLTGGTGYVGARLLPLLEQRALPLRCLARRPDRLRAPVKATTEIVQGDVLDVPSLHRALQGVHTAYYLVHLMSSSQDFATQDRQAATNLRGPPPRPESSVSSTLGASATTATRSCPRTCGAAMRSDTFCARPGWTPSSSGRRW